MKKRILSSLLAASAILTLVSCGSDDTCKITDGNGNTLEVSATEDTQTVATTIDTLKTVDVDNSNINIYELVGSLDLDVDVRSTGGNVFDLDASLNTDTFVDMSKNDTLFKHKFYTDNTLKLNANINIDEYLDEDEKIGVINYADQTLNALMFTDDTKIYVSYDGLKLEPVSGLLGSFAMLAALIPESGSYYMTLSALANSGLVEAFLPDFSDINSNYINQYFETLTAAIGTYDLVSKLGISISDAKKNEIEFKVDTKLANILDVLKSVDSEDAEDYTELSSIIGDIGINFTYRLDTTTLLPKSIKVETSNLDAAVSNILKSDNITDMTINTLSASAEVEFKYNTTIPTVDTKDYEDISYLYEAQ